YTFRMSCILRPRRGLFRTRLNPTAHTVGYYLAPFRLEEAVCYRTTGSTIREGRFASRYTLFFATCHLRLPLSGSPVLGFTSKRGKLLLEISRRMRWPRWNTSEVGYISM